MRAATLVALAFMSSLITQTIQAADPAAVQRTPATGVIKLEQLTPEQFHMLPDTAVIEVRGFR